MINNVSNIHLDRPATQAKILSIAQSKGLSVQEYNKSMYIYNKSTIKQGIQSLEELNMALANA